MQKLLCSNDIVQSIKNYSYNQVKLFYALLYHYKTKAVFARSNERQSIVNIDYLSNALSASKLSSQRIYDLIEAMPNEITIKEKDSITRIAVFSYISYSHLTSEIEYELNPTFKNNFLDDADCFTIINLENLYKLKSKYSQRMYELCSSYLNQKHVLIPIETFKEHFNVPDSYKSGNIDQSILNPSIAEINEKTNLRITIEKKKKRKKITHILFNIYSE